MAAIPNRNGCRNALTIRTPPRVPAAIIIRSVPSLAVSDRPTSTRPSHAARII
jgi:hypothetical protein